MFFNYMIGLEMNEYGMLNFEINKYINLKLYEVVRIGFLDLQIVLFFLIICNEKDWVEYSKY